MTSVKHACLCQTVKGEVGPACSFRVERPGELERLEPAEILKRVPVMAASAPATQELLATKAEVRRFGPGETLLRLGIPCRGLLLLVSGRAAVVQSRGGLWEHLITEIGPGFPLNLVAVLDRGNEVAEVRGKSEGAVLFWSQETIDQALETDPDLAKRLLHCLGGQYRTLIQRVAEISLLDIEERLARFVLRHAPGPGEPDLEEHWPWTHAEVANFLGASREDVTRILGKFRKRGWVGVRRRRVTLLDRPGLTRHSPPSMLGVWV